MSLTSTVQRVLAAMPTDHPTVIGPPFRVPPAAPCYLVELPVVREVSLYGGDCVLSEAAVDVVCVPATGTDHDMLVTMADAVVRAFGAAVTSGRAEPNPYTDVEDVWTYRLTVEV